MVQEINNRTTPRSHRATSVSKKAEFLLLAPPPFVALFTVNKCLKTFLSILRLGFGEMVSLEMYFRNLVFAVYLLC